METIHKVSLEEAKEIIREHYKLSQTAQIEIEDVQRTYTTPITIPWWPRTDYPYQSPIVTYCTHTSTSN